jgi:regulator of sigma E protease
MIEWLRTAAAIVFVFGIVIFIHELGHFLAAKLMGVYAPRFSIGFGPALWSRKWGETEYILAALPLGGYVRMASREDEAMAFLEGGSETPAATAGGSGAPAIAPEPKRPRYYDPNGMAPFGPRPVPEHRWFESKSLPARLFIMLAGVTMNFLLGFFILAGLFISTGEVVYQSREIGGILAVGGADTLLRPLAAGDTIIAVDGRPVQTWNEVQERIGTDTGAILRIQSNRGVATIPTLDTGLFSRPAIASIVLSPYLPPVVDRVVAGHPAEHAGLQTGDSITAVNGVPVRSWSGIVNRIEASPGKPLTLSVQRGGGGHEVTVTPEATPGVNPITQRDTVLGKIGASRKEIGTRHPIAAGVAVRDAWDASWASAGFIVHTLRQLVTGHQSLKGLSGPVGLAMQSSEAAKQGWAPLLGLISLLSINLAVFNLLPIPILDGGQIVLNIAESVKGKALNARTREWFFRIGLAAILVLFSIVMFNDMTALARRIFRL